MHCPVAFFEWKTLFSCALRMILDLFHASLLLDLSGCILLFSGGKAKVININQKETEICLVALFLERCAQIALDKSPFTLININNFSAQQFVHLSLFPQQKAKCNRTNPRGGLHETSLKSCATRRKSKLFHWKKATGLCMFLIQYILSGCIFHILICIYIYICIIYINIYINIY